MKVDSPGYRLLAITCLLLVFLNSCAFRRIHRYKDIAYMETDAVSKIDKQELNIFSPRRPKQPKAIFLFIHGGSWNSGEKSTYNFLGSRMARKGVITVIIDYPLSPRANYNQMAKASAMAVKWVNANIASYGGNPDKIFVSGHSAGGGLAALIAVRSQYFDSIGIANPIKGVILIDAAGLDMYDYLKEGDYGPGNTYLKTFTSKPAIWKEASPIYHLHKGMPPMLIYRGGETYPSIIKSNEAFVQALKKVQDEPRYYVLKRKKHIPMITQFFISWNPIYKQITEFMKEDK